MVSKVVKNASDNTVVVMYNGSQIEFAPGKQGAFPEGVANMLVSEDVNLKIVDDADVEGDFIGTAKVIENQSAVAVNVMFDGHQYEFKPGEQVTFPDNIANFFAAESQELVIVAAKNVPKEPKKIEKVEVSKTDIAEEIEEPAVQKFPCPICGKEFEKEPQVKGHLIHCKKKNAVKVEEVAEAVEDIEPGIEG